MEKRAGIVMAALVSLFWGIAAVQAAGPATKPAQPPQDPSVPAIKGEEKSPQRSAFLKRHQEILKIAKAGGVDVVFLGDSITAGWAGSGKDVWAKHYDSLHAANFGIGGDQTQHVLWRIQNGEFDGIQPKVVILMIGTNNVPSNPSDPAIAGGVSAIVKAVHDKVPEAKILLLAIFPRGEKPGGIRDRIADINSTIARLDDGKTVRYLDIGGKFLQSDGMISKEVMGDFLHPTAKGYQIWADAMQGTLDEMLK